MPKISETRKNARREHILEVARACLSKPGSMLNGVTLRELCRRGGFSSGMVYLYFKGGIQELLAEVLGDEVDAPFLSGSASGEPSAPAHGRDVRRPRARRGMTRMDSTLKYRIRFLVEETATDSGWRASSACGSFERQSRVTAIAALQAHVIRTIADEIENGEADLNLSTISIVFRESS
ncbi:TetR family transcriptional regulator [Candidatus Uhrbacteria bacterium]|nr:TetR family transcriptional regulator [Candidatus Uhrbacteria bacterium]